MRIVILTGDNRECHKKYPVTAPLFGPAPEALLQGFALLPEVEVHVISCLQQPVCSPEKLADNIWFHALQVPKIGWLRTGYQGCIRATRKKIREIHPDIVHGQGTERDCALNAIYSGFPNVLTIHGNMRAIANLYRSRIGSFDWFAARLENFALKRTDGVFCNSAHTESLVSPLAERTWRVPNAVRRTFFDQPLYQSSNAIPILLNVGELVPLKRQVEILAVARRLWRLGLRFEMQFVGSIKTRAKYGADFMRRLAEAETDGYARHLGSFQINELIPIFDHASALVHFPAEEAFGLVVAEALARNLKFFGARLGGITDIAEGTPGSEFFAESDWAGLTAAIARWINQGNPRAEGAAAVMRERYHPEVIARRHLEIYREVVNPRS